MTVSLELQNSGDISTGIVLVVFRDIDNPANTDAIIERTIQSASVADQSLWEEIGTIFNCDSAGSHFVDPLPLSDEIYYYRAKHVAVGFEDSDYVFEQSGKADIIPDIDLNTKPWLLNQSPLQLVMFVSQSNSTAWTLAPDVNQPVIFLGGGTPVVAVFSSANVGPIVSGSVPNTFVVDKPTGPAANGPSSVTFRSTLPQYIDGFDRVDLGPAAAVISPDDFLELVLTVTSSTANTLGISASADTTQPIGFGILSSAGVGTITTDAFGRFTIGRPTSGEGSVTFIVSSSTAGIVSDTDTVYVSKDPAPYLTVQSKVTAVTENAVTASVDIFDSNNQDSNLTGITLTTTSQSLAGFTAVQIGGVTQTTGKDTYTFHVTRPNYQQGTGRVSFTATKTGYTQDSDALDVPERVDQLAKLRTIISPVNSTDTAITVNVSVLDVLPLTGSYINLSFNSIGVPSVTPTGSFILSASEAKQYVISRPNFGTGTGRVNFTATASLRVNDTDSTDVPERTITSTTSELATITIGAVTSGSDNVNINYSFGNLSTAETVSVFAQESSVDPSIISVEFTGTRVSASPLFRNDGRSQFVVPIAQPSNFLLVTFVPFDFLNRRGTLVTRKFQATATAPTPPDAFVSQSNQTITDTSVTNRVMMPASNLPSFIRTVLDGAVYESDVAVTAGANATQSISHTDLTPDTLFEWQYFGVSSAGAVGTGTDFILTTTNAGGTLATPQFTVDAQDEGSNSWKIYFYITNEGDYPAGTTFEGEILDNAFVFLGDATAESQFDYYWETTDNTAGYARFRAVKSGFTTSAYSADQFWSANSLQPF